MCVPCQKQIIDECARAAALYDAGRSVKSWELDQERAAVVYAAMARAFQDVEGWIERAELREALEEIDLRVLFDADYTALDAVTGYLEALLDNAPHRSLHGLFRKLTAGGES